MSTSEKPQPPDPPDGADGGGAHPDVASGADKKVPAKKKKVSFKFALETSDDVHIVKKEPIASFAPPVPIIKKECLTRAIRIARGGESIIMPSRLTGLTQKFRNNNANNIDKLNSLTFKSQVNASDNAKLADDTPKNTGFSANAPNRLAERLVKHLFLIGGQKSGKDGINRKSPPPNYKIDDDDDDGGGGGDGDEVSLDENCGDTDDDEADKEPEAAEEKVKDENHAPDNVNVADDTSKNIGFSANTPNRLAERLVEQQVERAVDETISGKNSGEKRFVLPKRSVHSSRVIKPNKRFMDETQASTKKNGITSRKKTSKAEVSETRADSPVPASQPSPTKASTEDTNTDAKDGKQFGEHIEENQRKN